MLQINEIVKRYAQQTALDHVSMVVPSGSIFGLLGPNGAGKTSLIRIINQITAPDSGSIVLDGEPLNQIHVNRIGYLPEERGLYKKMQVGEQVVYFARLKGLSRIDAEKKSRYWFENFEMQSWWEKKVEDLSKGMQQKVQFISTILHDPDLLILDEPFSGFDPINAEMVKNEIIDLHQQGKTIIFSTHRLENIEEFVTHIALINKSKKILDGETKSIINQYRNNTYEVSFTGNGVTGIDWAGQTRFSLPKLTDVDSHHTAIIKLQDGSLNELLRTLLPVVDILGVKEVVPTVSDIFIHSVKAAEALEEPETVVA